MLSHSELIEKLKYSTILIQVQHSIKIILYNNENNIKTTRSYYMHLPTTSAPTAIIILHSATLSKEGPAFIAYTPSLRVIFNSLPTFSATALSSLLYKSDRPWKRGPNLQPAKHPNTWKL